MPEDYILMANNITVRDWDVSSLYLEIRFLTHY